MKNFSEASQKILNKYGIIHQKGFYSLVLTIMILTFIGGFTITFMNLDIHQIPRFKGDLSSWDFIMPCLGGFLSTILFPKFHKFFPLKKILKFSLFVILINYSLMIFFINSFFNFPIRFSTGFFYGTIFLIISCLQAETFKAPFRATLFGIMGIVMVSFASLGSSFVDFFQHPYQVFGISICGILLCLFILWTWKDISDNIEPKAVEKQKESPPSFYKIIIFSPFIFISFFMISGVDNGFGSYLAIFCEGRGLKEGSSALVYSFSNLGGLAFMPITGILADKWGYEKTLFLVSFIGLIGAIGAFFFTQIVPLSLIFFLAFAATQSFGNLILSWVASTHSGSNLSYGMSTISLLGSSSAILAPLVIGALMQSFGNNGFLYWTCGGMLMGMILMAFQVTQKTI